MKVLASLLFAAALLTFASTAQATKAAKPAATPRNPVVVMDTTLGKITLELNEEKAPITVKNFLRYVDEKFYDGTVFHRVINGFMIQGGGFTKEVATEKPTHEPIKNEGQNGLKNEAGTIAMARLPQVDSATAQFFINVANNAALDYPSNGGYAVFGKVIEGMDVVDRIKTVTTGTHNGMGNVPTTPVVINSIRVKK
jgi:peptidyl-prolyl cis-trans isomerase A (cyclophilin A)